MRRLRAIKRKIPGSLGGVITGVISTVIVTEMNGWFLQPDLVHVEGKPDTPRDSVGLPLCA